MSTISIEQAVRNGIEIELAAQRFYLLLQTSTDDPKARKFLRQMAMQELEHAKRIERLGKTLTPNALPRQSDDQVETIETAPKWAFVDDISYEQSLMVALENEEHAALYYGALADSTSGAVSDFFQMLCEDEQLHIRKIKKRLKLD